MVLVLVDHRQATAYRYPGEGGMTSCPASPAHLGTHQHKTKDTLPPCVWGG